MTKVNPSMDLIVSPIFGIGNYPCLSNELNLLKSETTFMVPFSLEMANVGDSHSQV
jgi:hypothetical protein